MYSTSENHSFSKNDDSLSVSLRSFAFAAEYFAVPAAPECTFQEGTGFAAEGYVYDAGGDRQACCEICAADPTCKAGVLGSDGKCYVKFSVDSPTTGTGTACIKQY